MDKFILAPALAAAIAIALTAGAAQSQSDNITATRSEGGRYYTADDVPTYSIAEDGTIDWMTYSGFRRYHSECHVCHGPEGEGSSYAPALKNSAINLDYYAFIDVVTNGRQVVNSATHNVMPAFGDNPNVMCYIDDIYVYLKARGTNAVPRGRPAKRQEKSDEIRAAEAACLGK